MKTFFFTTIIATLLMKSSVAQQNDRQAEQNKLTNKLHDELNRKAIRDTNQVVMFAYKVHVAKQTSGDYKVLSITVSDSTAFTYFPRIEFLKTCNYKLLANDKAEAVFVIPIALLIGYPSKVNSGLVDIRYFDKGLINYLYLHDEKSSPLDASSYIYLPLGIIKTTSAIDY